MSASALATLAALPPGLVWQADRLARPAEAGMPTGFAALDAQLPGGGWPRGALIELLGDAPGIGELGLLLPMLRAVAAERWIAWIAPPHLPYAPALAAAGLPLDRLLLLTPDDHAETLWAIRQALASGGCEVVLAWLARADTAALRRLQLAAEESATPLFLFRPAAAALQSSPASLRLRLVAAADALTIDILKRRGPALATPIRLTIPNRPASDLPLSPSPSAPRIPSHERRTSGRTDGSAHPPQLPRSSQAPKTIQPARPKSSRQPAPPPMQPPRLSPLDSWAKAGPPSAPARLLAPTHPTPLSHALDPTHDALVCTDPPRLAVAGIHARRG